MKSLLIITENFPNQENSFLGTYVVEQLRQLQREYRIVLLVPSYIPIKKRLRVRQSKRERLEGMDVHRLQHYPWWMVGLQLLGLISKHRIFAWNKRRIRRDLLDLAQSLHRIQPFDLVHGHEIYIGDEAVPIGRVLGIPSVVTIHGLYPLHEKNLGRDVMRAVLDNLRQATAVVTVSETARQTYLAAGLIHNHFTVIHNGTEIRLAPPLPAPWPERIAGKRLILSVGFFTPEKRMDQIIRLSAALVRESQFADVRTIIIGRGQEEKAIRQLIHKYGLADRVWLAGEVRPNVIDAFFAACDVFVLASVSESFSLVCLEALAQGKPVVCTSNAGIIELLENQKNACIVAPDNLTALKDNVKMLLERPDLRKQMGRAGQAVAASLSWLEQTAKVRALYAELFHA